MPICKKCNSQIPTSAIIDGKRRRLEKRKYCLTCLPFGTPRTRGLYSPNPVYENLEYEKLKCSTCPRVYDYHHKDPKGHTRTKCNSCLVNHRRFDLKKKCVEYKGGKCERCDYNKSQRALSFHHKDESQKDFGISGKHCYTWERVKNELDKCIMVCANCHMEIHEEIENGQR